MNICHNVSWENEESVNGEGSKQVLIINKKKQRRVNDDSKRRKKRTEKIPSAPTRCRPLSRHWRKQFFFFARCLGVGDNCGVEGLVFVHVFVVSR